MTSKRRPPPNAKPFQAAYSEERLIQIQEAFVVWVDSLPKPSRVIAAQMLGCSKDRLSLWYNRMVIEKAGISPYFMNKLRGFTGDAVFDLLPEEEKIFRDRKLIDEDGQPVKQNTSRKKAKKKTFNLDRTSIFESLSEERIAEIRLAVKEFCDSMARPKTETAKRYGFVWRAISTWTKDRFPSLGSLIALFRVSGDKRFLLTKEEQDVLTVRGIEVPEDYLKGEKQEAKSPPKKKAPKKQTVLSQNIETSDTTILEKVVERGLLAMMSMFHTLVEPLKVLRSNGTIPLVLRQQALRLIEQLANEFGLSGKELQEDVAPETDPATIERMERLLQKGTTSTKDNGPKR